MRHCTKQSISPLSCTVGDGVGSPRRPRTGRWRNHRRNSGPWLLGFNGWRMDDLIQLVPDKRHLRRRLAASAFLDVVGYSRLMATNEDATLHAWDELRHSTIEP